MRVELVAPPPADLTNGNRVTAMRWARMIRELGHSAHVQHGYDGRSADVLVALHAVKSYSAVRQFRARYPDRPVVVALTGTDVYGDHDYEAALSEAVRIIVLQKRALRAVGRGHRARTRVIYQSAEPLEDPPPRVSRRFRVAVVGHMRAVKDPFRTAIAARGLPESSRVEIRHAGEALNASMKRRAKAEMDRNPRYRWIGATTPGAARRLIASSHLVAITSHAEGSSNVLSEALAARTPVIASRIPGLIGTLGASYPGFFVHGDTAALRRLLVRAETDPSYYRRLQHACRTAAKLVEPRRERAAWRALLRELR
jgi:putative glycosyltransferase (TIGR04348 family)